MECECKFGVNQSKNTPLLLAEELVGLCATRVSLDDMLIFGSVTLLEPEVSPAAVDRSEDEDCFLAGDGESLLVIGGKAFSLFSSADECGCSSLFVLGIPCVLLGKFDGELLSEFDPPELVGTFLVPF